MRLGFFKTPFFFLDGLLPYALVLIFILVIEEVVRLDGLLPDRIKSVIF